MHIGVHGIGVPDTSMLLFRVSSNFAKCGWLKDKKKASSVAEQNYMHRFQADWEVNFENVFVGNGDLLG